MADEPAAEPTVKQQLQARLRELERLRKIAMSGHGKGKAAASAPSRPPGVSAVEWIEQLNLSAGKKLTALLTRLRESDGQGQAAEAS